MNTAPIIGEMLVEKGLRQGNRGGEEEEVAGGDSQSAGEFQMPGNWGNQKKAPNKLLNEIAPFQVEMHCEQKKENNF